MGAFCSHRNQSFKPICPKTLRNLSPTLMMLHIKFDQHGPTGLRDIQVSSELWQNDRIPEGQGKSSIVPPPLFQSGAIMIRNWYNLIPYPALKFKSRGTLFKVILDRFWPLAPRWGMEPGFRRHAVKFNRQGTCVSNIIYFLYEWLPRYILKNFHAVWQEQDGWQGWLQQLSLFFIQAS